MDRVSFLRAAGWVGPEDLPDTLTIIGCGAVGSHIALFAAEMGFHKFQLFDADIVEDHNLPNQAYDLEHVGQRKVDALEAVLQRFNPDVQVVKHAYFFTTAEHKDLVDGPLVIATDSMKSRRDIYDTFYMNAEVDHVYEVRLGFDYGELNVLDNTNVDQCEQWCRMLRSDDEVPDGPCNLRICTTLVAIVSAYAVHTMCAKYAAERQSADWEFKTKTIFNLSPQLSVYSL